MRYNTYAELAQAYRDEEIKTPLMVDNDWCGAYIGDVKVFEGSGPADVIEILELLGIPAEPV